MRPFLGQEQRMDVIRRGECSARASYAVDVAEDEGLSPFLMVYDCLPTLVSMMIVPVE